MISNDFKFNRVNSAYTHSTAFDDSKKRDAEEAAESKTVKDSYEGKKVGKEEKKEPRFEPRRENGITFKSGFAFVYGKEEEIEIEIHSSKKIKIKSNSEGIELRKPFIKELVALAMGSRNLEEFNSLFKDEEESISILKKEVAEMGLDPNIPFGLGLDDYYIQQNSFYKYKKMDLSA